MSGHRKWSEIRHKKDERSNAVPCQTIGCGRMVWANDALCDYHREES